MNLHEKILTVMQAVSYLNKDDNVEYGNTKYKALTEEKVTQIMREQFVKNKLLVYPIEMTSARNGQISHVDVKYRIQNAEAPEEYIDVVSCGDGADSQDKGAGKAMTYAFKYMWLRTFAIPTGEDPDKISSEELDSKVYCVECGKEITPYIGKNDKKISVEQHANGSKNKYGYVMCLDCIKKVEAAKAERMSAI